MKRLILAAALTLLATILATTVVLAAGDGGGFDQYGYNDSARVFNGTGLSWGMGKFGWTEEQARAYLGPYADDKLVMKWNDEWDRGNAEGWSKPPYRAWTTNHWNGKSSGSGSVWFYKIIWVGSGLQNSPYWQSGGYPIWGQFEVIMDQGVDPSMGPGHIVFARATPNGLGRAGK